MLAGVVRPGLIAASLLLCALPGSVPGAAVAAEPPPDVSVSGLSGEASAVERVVAISIDALNPAALRRLGPRRAPHLHRLIAEGASTLNGRSQVESTETLPNHTSMVTGRRVRAARDGHGVTWNNHRPDTTVQSAAGHDVASVFTVAHTAGSTAVFAAKQKFTIFERSWPDDIDRMVVREGDDTALMRAARADLLQRDRVLTFVHFAEADVVGHERGFMSRAYLRAVRRVDALVGRLLRAIDGRAALAGTAVVLTADHGGRGKDHHGDRTAYANYRVPFVVWGPGVTHGDLYALNPTYADPGRSRAPYRGAQPIRNGDLANVTLDLLGLGPVPGSRYDVAQLLSVG